MGCVTEDMVGAYQADTLMCSNQKMKKRPCMPMRDIDLYMGCYECSHPPCDDVLTNFGYTAKTICPLGTRQCYSSRRSDGVTFRGCYSGVSEGIQVCKNSLGACKICRGNYCNSEKLVTEIETQCYKSNWKRPDKHETTLRFADCTGSAFYGTHNLCYIAASSRLFMRMGCVSELVSGIDESYALTLGDTNVVWLYQNYCYKCVSNEKGYCLDVQYLKTEKCLGFSKYPARGCYTLTDNRSQQLSRGCLTELSEYMMVLCNMPIFFEACSICVENGCNNAIIPGWKKHFKAATN